MTRILDNCAPAYMKSFFCLQCDYSPSIINHHNETAELGSMNKVRYVCRQGCGSSLWFRDLDPIPTFFKQASCLLLSNLRHIY